MENSLSLNFKNNNVMKILYGERNANLKTIEHLLNVHISSRGSYLAISGEDSNIKLAAEVLEELYAKIESEEKEIEREDIVAVINSINNNERKVKSKGVKSSELVLKTRKRNIFPYNEKQHRFIKTLMEKDVTFGIGVAGTGKTYLAVATAVSMFLEKKVERIILTRPAVEAGEKIGFLPGDIKDKVDPYLQPLYDALYDMLPAENIERYFATRELEVAPLAFMRGRTLSKAFVILDEAQNVTIPQMKMFLTRLGNGSKMAITGDLTQIDLPNNVASGLIDAIERLKKLKEIGLVKFETKEVVRHPLTRKIIESYEQ